MIKNDMSSAIQGPLMRKEYHRKITLVRVLCYYQDKASILHSAMTRISILIVNIISTEL